MTLSIRALALPIGLAASSAFLLADSDPAWAHHLMELSGTPQGSLAGLLSGLAHPLLGPDHLVFLLAIGLVGLARPLRWVPLLLAAGLAGSALGLLLPGLPAAESLVAASLVILALVLQCRWDSRLLLPLIALHGYGLSGTVVGWEATPLAFYLLGLMLSQGGLLLAAVVLVRRWRDHASAQTLSLLSGTLIGLGGAFVWSAMVA